MAKKKGRSAKSKVTRTAKRKSTTRKRGSGNPFAINNVPTLID